MRLTKRSLGIARFKRVSGKMLPSGTTLWKCKLELHVALSCSDM